MNPLPRRRRNLFAIFLIDWGLLVVGRLAQLQLAQGAKYRARAQKQQETRIQISPRRGSILDREGRDLAVSVEVASVAAAPEEISDAAGEARVLAPLLGMPEKALLAKLSSIPDASADLGVVEWVVVARPSDGPYDDPA